MDALIEKALTTAPFLVIGLAGVAYIAKLFLKHIAEAEEQRREWASERHAEFFEVMQGVGERSNAVIRENTKALGEVAAHLRRAE